jgi:hypothetical protein
MTTELPPPNSHLHFFNHHTGRPRFHFEEAPPLAPPPAPPPALAWHTGIDAEFIGHAQNKGWKLDDPKEAFVAATKQARELEKHFGVPADQLVKMPKADAKPEEFRAYYERLGAPKEAKDYDLSAVTDPAIADSLRATMHERGVPKDAAASIATTVAKALESRNAQQATLDADKMAEQRASLEKNWGGKDSAAYQFNHLQAIEGARRLGITPEAVKTMEGQIGYDKVMEAMRKIGANTREDTFVEKSAGANQGDVTTLEGAAARKQELMADTGWRDRYLAGGVAEKREMNRLNQMITGVSA